ncbi:MAG: ral secretion pathway protein GspM [Sphingomonas bacterium]|uniref:type II secretion system protein GspM n=1 Tax=Sphingomonas bacterium TaxID=1895847 RepID=UPI002633252C|nr:type II secretion system protein GspM [Sphingomonas bacterium]MDB5695368.1 ral secretion pathway protein GspM [Sphingomonas bacterium]
MIAWFNARSLREKRLLVVMVALLALTLVWLLVIRPFGDALSSERERHAAAVIRLGETQARVDTLRQIGRLRAAPLTGSFADAVRARAADAGFAIALLQEDGPGRVRVAIAGARPAVLVLWLARLELAGILVEGATFTDKGDRTVGVQLTLRARAR